MNTYREVSLPTEANKYIRECLEDGNSLAKHLLTQLERESGRVVTFLPHGVAPGTTQQFKSGGVTSAKESESWLVTLIQASLSRGEGCLCFLENALARPSDPILSSSKTRILIFRDEIYHFLSERDVESEKIRQTIRRAESPHLFIGIVTSLPKERSFPYEARKVTITSDELLRDLAERTEKIVVGAYDGEGYLVWNKA
ncbi:hypothetical protein HYR99_04195 [Candidatus Poribacteria bacterium]|nr:hypothetical protein [Candidatus Poribacteria bacterium]